MSTVCQRHANGTTDFEFDFDFYEYDFNFEVETFGPYQYFRNKMIEIIAYLK